MSVSIKKYNPDFLPGIKELYGNVVTKDPNAVFWWPAEHEGFWEFCYCAFDDDKLIGKGQVQPISIMQPGTNTNGKHHIYVNIKLHSDYEADKEVFTKLYEVMYEKANEIRAGLPKEFESLLCVGNSASEISNNTLFIEKGFTPFQYLYGMVNDLSKPTESSAELGDIGIQYWKMESDKDEQDYLQLEALIWPESQLGLNRLREYKSNKNWTAITARTNGEIVGSVMCWEELDAGSQIGIIEDLFVLPNWRKKGIAKALLLKALFTLKESGLQKAELMVSSENPMAISLYESVGFSTESEEIRYCISLV